MVLLRDVEALALLSGVYARHRVLANHEVLTGLAVVHAVLRGRRGARVIFVWRGKDALVQSPVHVLRFPVAFLRFHAVVVVQEKVQPLAARKLHG